MLPSRNTDIGLLILRLAFGLSMLIGHGWGKFQRLISGDPIEFADPFGLGPAISLGLSAFAEAFCSILITLGLFTRPALIFLVINMLVAIFYQHLGDPFGRWEKALMYLSVYVSLLLLGPGWYSLDEQWRKRV